MHFSPLPHESIGPRGLSSTAGLVLFSAALTLSACSGSVGTQKTPAPGLTFTVSPTSVQSGQPVSLSWNATNAGDCQASDGWSGTRATSGSESAGPLSSDARFTLTCNGPGGSVTGSRNVTVATTTGGSDPAPVPEPGPEPQVSLTAASTLVTSGSSTTLTWNASNASTCTASGGWSGSRATSGSADVGPISRQTTFSLSCSGSGGSALAMVSISVRGSIGLSWVAPTENVDGSALTDLAGYRVYYGVSSRAYTDMTEVGSPTATSTTLALPSGDYYVAMTALDGEGNESAYSNEVRKSVP